LAGVLLLDPTIKEGFPLWRGRRNWQTTPSVNNDAAPPPGPGGNSFFEDFLYYALKPELFTSGSSPDGFPPDDSPLDGSPPDGSPPDNQHSGSPGGQQSNIHVPIQALLQLICGEWLTVTDYIKARLCQIDWEIAFPEDFLEKRDIGTTLKKLHMWRRFVPLYREMLSETLNRVFHFSCHGMAIARTGGGDGGLNSCHCTNHGSEIPPPRPIDLYRQDFELVLSYVKEYQERIDRLTAVVTAAISIRDSERAIADNRNLGRLTWLATFFLPFSLIATTFCMQLDVTAMTVETVRWYFAVSLPLAAVSTALAIILSLPVVQKKLGIANYNTNP
jgi:hypothetical protein